MTLGTRSKNAKYRGNTVVGLLIFAGLTLALASCSGNEITWQPGSGNSGLALRDLDIESQLYSGGLAHLSFDLVVPSGTTDSPDEVSVYLEKTGETAASADDPGDFGYPVTHHRISDIDKVATRADTAGMWLQRFREFSATLEDDGNGGVYHVESLFQVPEKIKAGDYRVVVTLEGGSDSVRATYDPVQILEPDDPELFLSHYGLDNNSFLLPESRLDLNDHRSQAAMHLSVEFANLGASAREPVELTTALEIDGQTFPVYMMTKNSGGALQVAGLYTPPRTCINVEDADGTVSEDCAFLRAQEISNVGLRLFLSNAAYDVLASLTSDLTCTLRILLDPENKVDEIDETNNAYSIPVRFLAGSIEAASGSEKTVFDAANMSDSAHYYGNKYMGVGYTLQPSYLKYSEDTVGESDIPQSAEFAVTGELYARISKNWIHPDTNVQNMAKLDLVYAHGDASYDVTKTSGNEAAYKVTILGYDLVNESVKLDGDYKLVDWTYSKDKKGKIFEVDIDAYICVVKMAVGYKGELGLHGEVTLSVKENTFTLDALGGPYASLEAWAQVGVSVVIAEVGVGVELTLINVTAYYNPTLTWNLNLNVARFTHSWPLVIRTLDGKVYVYATVLFWDWKWPLATWDGWAVSLPLIPTVSLMFGDYLDEFFNPDLTKQDGVIFDNVEAGTEYTGYWEFRPGAYAFYTENIQSLYINDQKVCDGDCPQGGTKAHTVYGNDVRAVVTVRVTTSERGGAQLWWDSTERGAECLATFYYKGEDCKDNPVWFQCSEKIDFYWGDKSPNKKYIDPGSSFSVRWKGKFTGIDGDNILLVTSDDTQPRIFVDGHEKELINHPTNLNKKWAEQTLSDMGETDFSLEYSHTEGNAYVTLDVIPSATWFIESTSTWNQFGCQGLEKADVHKQQSASDVDYLNFRIPSNVDYVPGEDYKPACYRLNQLTANGWFQFDPDKEKVIDFIAGGWGNGNLSLSVDGLRVVNNGYTTKDENMRENVGRAIMESGYHLVELSWTLKDEFTINPQNMRDVKIWPVHVRWSENRTDEYLVEFYRNGAEMQSVLTPATDEEEMEKTPLYSPVLILKDKPRATSEYDEEQIQLDVRSCSPFGEPLKFDESGGLLPVDATEHASTEIHWGTDEDHKAWNCEDSFPSNASLAEIAVRWTGNMTFPGDPNRPPDYHFEAFSNTDAPIHMKLGGRDLSGLNQDHTYYPEDEFYALLPVSVAHGTCSDGSSSCVPFHQEEILLERQKAGDPNNPITTFTYSREKRVATDDYFLILFYDDNEELIEEDYYMMSYVSGSGDETAKIYLYLNYTDGGILKHAIPSGTCSFTILASLHTNASSAYVEQGHKTFDTTINFEEIGGKPIHAYTRINSVVQKDKVVGSWFPKNPYTLEGSVPTVGSSLMMLKVKQDDDACLTTDTNSSEVKIVITFE